MRLADGSLRTMTEARRCYPDFDVTRSWDLPSVPARAGEDLESYLRRLGFNEAQLGYVQRGFAGAQGEAMRNISAASSLEMTRNRTAGSGDWRILDGYDRLLAFLAEGLDIRLGTVVEAIDWSGPGVRVHARDGGVYESDRAVITLPLGVLKAGRVRFVPELPAEKRAAIGRLGVGPVMKMVYRFSEPILPEGVMALYSVGNPCMWWSPSYGQTTGEYVITAFVTADRARELVALGEAAALESGVRVLQKELHRGDLQPLAARMVNWIEDPFALGGYSVTAPGAEDAHDALAAPVAGRLFWAGEATAGRLWKATVHGAYASGCRAAADIVTSQDQMRTQEV